MTFKTYLQSERVNGVAKSENQSGVSGQSELTNHVVYNGHRLFYLQTTIPSGLRISNMSDIEPILELTLFSFVKHLLVTMCVFLSEYVVFGMS